jgi:thioredoxin-like negative regulator of GroEL
MKMSRVFLVGGVLVLSSSTLSAQFVPGRGHNGYDGFSQGRLSSSLLQFELNTSVVPPASAPTGTIDQRELRIPDKAIREFDRSMKAFDSGDFRAAANHLEKATKIAPDFVQAHNNLGSMYINLKEYDRAIDELQKTIALRPNLETPYHNLAMLMILLQRLPEAEAAARQVLELQPQQSGARFTLGRILVMQKQYTTEAVRLLTDASPEIPAARLPLANVLQHRGETDRAIAELRAYLQNPDPGKKDRVQTWLSQLTQLARVKIESIPMTDSSVTP